MSSEDILIWADCTWGCRYELSRMNHMSDDYFVLQLYSPNWLLF
jgi:hypothetical protein